MNENKNYSDYIIDINIPKESFPKYTLPKLLPVSLFGMFDDKQYINDWVNRMSLERMNEQVPDEYKVMLTYVEYYEK